MPFQNSMIRPGPQDLTPKATQDTEERSQSVAFVSLSASARGEVCLKSAFGKAYHIDIIISYLKSLTKVSLKSHPNSCGQYPVWRETLAQPRHRPDGRQRAFPEKRKIFSANTHGMRLSKSGKNNSRTYTETQGKFWNARGWARLNKVHYHRHSAEIS
jgi:hypothetical protein